MHVALVIGYRILNRAREMRLSRRKHVADFAVERDSAMPEMVMVWRGANTGLAEDNTRGLVNLETGGGEKPAEFRGSSDPRGFLAYQGLESRKICHWLILGFFLFLPPF